MLTLGSSVWGPFGRLHVVGHKVPYIPSSYLHPAAVTCCYCQTRALVFDRYVGYTWEKRKIGEKKMKKTHLATSPVPTTYTTTITIIDRDPDRLLHSGALHSLVMVAGPLVLPSAR